MWDGAITEHSGFVAVPVSLLKLQAKFGLSAVDMLVLINLLGYRWAKDAPVFPRNSIIATRMGITERTVQRTMSKLLRLRLVERSKDEKGLRVYKLENLVRRVAELTPSVERIADAFNDDV